MHATAAITLLLLPLLPLMHARPIQESQMTSTTWTIRSFTRTCYPTANKCAYSFGIDTDDGQPVTSCAYIVAGDASTPAARKDYSQVVCGAFFISSGWSGQFGPGNGFQTLSVVRKRTIAYPAYADWELANGEAVTPDKSYTPQALP